MEFYKKLYTNGRNRLWVKFTCSKCLETVDMFWKSDRYTGICPTCKGGRQPGYGKDDFIVAANLVHSNKYTYGKVVYVNAHVKVVITCREHGDFTQKPANHITLNNGCPVCGAFDKRKHLADTQHSVYHVYFPEYGVYKIGVTNKKISYRFSGEPSYTLIWEVVFVGAKAAYDLEGLLLKEYKSYKYLGIPILKSGGNTELLTVLVPKPELHT